MIPAINTSPRSVPPGPAHRRSFSLSIIEATFYVLILYGNMGEAWGISVGLLGAGTMAVLAASCLLGTHRRETWQAIAFPVLAATAFVSLQLLAHGESLMGDYVRPFVTWSLALIVVQTLSFRRGFLHRLALSVLAVGCTALPQLSYQSEAFGVQRAGLDRAIGLANPNDLGAWFGFCCVYFVVVGFDARRNVLRLLSWLLAAGCLFVVALTVSRGPLFAAALATVVGLRNPLKRGFLPLLCLLSFVWVVYELEVFEQAAASYAARLTQETGRFLVWPLAFDRFLDSPVVGVGVSNVATYVPHTDHPITPHNSFLFIALASGVIPLVFFLAYWWRAACGVLRGLSVRAPDSSILLPLYVYSLLVALFLNTPFTSPWMVASLAGALAAGTRRSRPLERGLRTVARGTDTMKQGLRPPDTSGLYH